MEVVNNQINENDPPETNQTMERLISEGYSDEQAREFIAQAVCIEVWDTMRNQKEFDLQRYVRNLNSLPNEPKE